MGLKGIDWKEFGLKYGERIGLGVGVGFMLLLVVWGLLGGGPDLTKEVIAKNARDADNAITTNPVDEEKLVPPEVITLGKLNQLAQAIAKTVSPDGHRFAFSLFAKLQGDDTFRTNPEVLTATELVGRPVLLAFKIIEIRNGKVLVAEPTKDAGKFKQDDRFKEKRKDKLRQGDGGFGPGFPGPGGGGGGGPGFPGGGGGGPGAGGGARGPGGGGPGGPGAGGGLGGPGAGGGARGPGMGGPGGPIGPGGGEGLPGMPGGAELWNGKWIDINLVEDRHILANNLYPARIAYIVGSYPHAKQMEEIAKALRIPNQEAPLLYKGLEVQRREIVLKGTRMPDGTVIAEDMVRMPADRSLKALSSFPPNLQNPQTEANAAAAGWVTIDQKNIARLLNLAVELEPEDDPAQRALMEQCDRLIMKRPKAQRGSYPDIVKELKQVNDALEKIREKGKPPPRKRDPRLGPDDFDPFGMASEDRFGGAGGGLERGGGGGGAGPLGAGGGAGSLSPGGGSSRPPGYPGGGGEASLRPGGGAGGGAAGIGSGAGGGAAGIGGPTGGGAGSLLNEFQDMHGLIRFLDLDLNTAEAAGKTYEYRLRVVLQNPNFGHPNVVENPDFAKEEFLKGGWSPTTRVTFPEEAYVYADERARDKSSGVDKELDRVPVQIHKWLGFISTRGVIGDERVGDWWVERVLAPRGEYLGLGRMTNPPLPGKPNYEEIPLIVWLATQPDADSNNKMGTETINPKLRTDALTTRLLLADFEGGYRVSRRPPGKLLYYEDLPAEILVVEPNGRMYAKTLTKDKEDTDRKTRFDTWDKWFKFVKDRYEAKKPKEDKKDKSRPDL